MWFLRIGWLRKEDVVLTRLFGADVTAGTKPAA